MKLLLFVIILSSALNLPAQKYVLQASGPVSDFIVDNNTIIASTTKGTVEVFNIKTHKLIRKISFPKIKDFAGDLIDAEVFKVIKINSTIYAIVHGLGGFTDIYQIIGSTKTKLIEGKRLNAVAMALSVSYDNQLIIGLLSNEIIKYQLAVKKIVYRKQISNYAFSAMTMSEDNKYLFVSDESGEIHKVDIKTGMRVKTYKGQNVDNVLAIAYSSGIIVCGGKDRRFSVYNTKNGNAFHVNTNYFINVVGISKSGKFAVWFDDNTNDLILFNIQTKSRIKTLSGHKSMVNKIKYTTENQIISCGADKQIIIWKI